MVNTKEYRGISGIYKIECTINGKVYIGSAVDIGGRWSSHLSDLYRNKHHSIHLQRAFNKYGPEIFRFSVIEVVEYKSNLSLIEQYWLDYYKSYNPKYGYNICLVAGSCLGIKASNKAKINMSLSKKGISKSPEHKKKISESHKGMKASDSAKNNMSKAQKGRKLSVEQIQKMSKSWIVTSSEGNSFKIVNLRKFCRENLLDQSSMRKVAMGIYKQHKGWTCQYADKEKSDV